MNKVIIAGTIAAVILVLGCTRPNLPQAGSNPTPQEWNDPAMTAEDWAEQAEMYEVACAAGVVAICQVLYGPYGASSVEDPLEPGECVDLGPNENGPINSVCNANPVTP